MTPNDPRDHHYVPQFFLRNFAVDEAKSRITTVGKHGPMAVWAERSIESLGYERDFYVHLRAGIPVSVETDINRRIETPISQSDTWAKIVSGRTDALDQSDRAILYALIRHLEARTPHYQATMNELAQIARDPLAEIALDDEERAVYAAMHADPNLAKAMRNHMAATTAWAERSFKGASIMILRSPIAIRSSTTPVFAMPVPPHPAMALPLPGMVPYQLVLTINPTTIACLVLGDFDGAFSNREIDATTAAVFNRHFVGQFAKFDYVRHLITPPDNIVVDMTWAPYDLVESSVRKIVFRRRA
ncbi:DUF4238 domain-containing protein [Rhizobium leguminosarum]|uniref:DUF4238 domain-containing protein n=1 Tax=Rhizobium leguminosarum TaxID=384 RepID=UPI0013EEAFB1|nr:DUF4238 domain-containing protein [Rhizobium leguminosarum]